MAILPKLRDLLDQHRVEYTHHVHPLVYTAKELASAEHLPEHEVVKTVVFLGDNGFGMAVLCADCMVDLFELRSALGLTRLRLATETELADLFPECELGAMPPFGNLFGMAVFVDSRVAGEEYIAFNAGTHRDVVILRFKDYRSLANPEIIHFARFATA